MLLSHILNRSIHVGRLEVIDAGGKSHVFSGKPGPRATVRLHDRALNYKLALYPELYLGEAYMDGSLTVEEGTLLDVMEIAVRNLETVQAYPLHAVGLWLSRLFRCFQQHNPIRLARAHVAHHYDLPDRLYDLFLDPERQYSCAYFQDPGDDLETAQLAKQRHLAAKLLLKPGQRVLDIGSGWGGLALHLAEVGGGRVSGLTLSTEQLRSANRRAAESGLADRVQFHLRDYREESGTYDRIVSVGMFEHVGVSNYPAFFAKIGELLNEDGVFVLHAIGRMRGPSSTCSWIRKYIFPGGYSPALSELLPAIERSGLWVTDIEILRLHYAETLRAWRQRFEANRETVAALLDDRFCRMWEFYLVLSEAAFRWGDHFVFQVQIAKRRDAVPITRDYILDSERMLSDEAVARARRNVA